MSRIFLKVGAPTIISNSKVLFQLNLVGGGVLEIGGQSGG